ncbi:MAG: HigA family addiction module antidote protein [bacterium]|nr:HigA family addiction module antidote protein [bacterium]
MERLDDSRGFAPDIAIPPGETLKETIDALGMTQVNLATRMGRPLKTINEVIKGKTAITAQTATELERVLGAPATFWLRLEMDYQVTLARLKERKGVEKDISLLERFPYTEMAKLGWVEKVRDKADRVLRLRSYLGVASLDRVPLVEEAAFRKSPKRKASPEALSAWMRQGELLAQHVEAEPFDKRRLLKNLELMRELTRKSIRGATTEMARLCAEAGVALVFVPHLAKTYANGAAFWISADKAVIQLSIRNRYEDVFWFTLFHEAGHIVKHSKKETFIDTDCDAQSEREGEANTFAGNILIPPGDYAAFVRARRYSAGTVRQFAKSIGVSAAVVVGRLQHDELLPLTHLHGLRRKLEWAQPE